MIKVVIIGSGNLAFHLTNECLKSNAINLVQVYSRNIENIEYLKSKTSITHNLKNLKEADIYIIAVSDNAIADVSSQLMLQNKLVVHTSGAIGLNELKSQSNKGVFYPLQSFSKSKKIDFTTIPICIEAENKKDLKILEKLAKLVSNKVYYISSDQRKSLHVSAVFVNNFVNHMYYIGNEICNSNNIPFEILAPLINETSKKIESLTPFEAQTGPAKRNDTKTIEEHLSSLNKNQQDIYKLITKSIQELYGKKL
ncbi:DUF2520 domain-containing protein [Lutibacter sp. HS1-25]|uniref:Rossmann-like and DUF2520 domain-containing protein n=1 Tax=Lutibacter sp. HS1-25 TaxID=2485000 RepID=UPI0010135FBF|nr:Rossmann-like and DUF2520 domain-containing protein [Lutibacter sp. HS1-25]RXP53060.1 DUF2520 domain-containing protein [Lutibacter sp. HS1-25]